MKATVFALIVGCLAASSSFALAIPTTNPAARAAQDVPTIPPPRKALDVPTIPPPRTV